MRVETKNVFYCDHCGRHRLTRRAIEQHEPHCVYNPQRVCKWRSGVFKGYRPSRDFFADNLVHPEINTDELASAVVERGSGWLEWLRGETEGCPACMLAVIVQARVKVRKSEGQWWHEVFTDEGWDYEKEVEGFRERERNLGQVSW